MVKKVLIGIVDDHVQTAVSISQLLEFNGFKTFQAYNADEAIKKIKSENPDLAILDIKLEGNISSIELAKMFPKLKVIFMSGFDLDEGALKGVKNYITVLRKPLDTDELLSILRKEFKLKKPKIG